MRNFKIEIITKIETLIEELEILKQEIEEYKEDDEIIPDYDSGYRIGGL